MVIKSSIKPVTIFIGVFLLLASCGLVGGKEKQEPFEPVFKAEINGEPFNGVGDWSEQFPPGAGMTMQGEYPYLSIFGVQFSEEFYPYNESIGISLFYKKEQIQYATRQDTVKINEDYERFSGGRYSENEGDANISMYRSLDDHEGYITVEMDTLESGEVVVFGTFRTQVIMIYRTDAYSQRVGQDTLHITNGEYRLLLDDRREE